MKTKFLKFIGTILVLSVTFWLGSLTGNNNHDYAKHSTKPTFWTCSMHPQIQLPEFGQCPICFMDLIPLNSDNSGLNTEIKMSESAMKLAEIHTTTISV